MKRSTCVDWPSAEKANRTKGIARGFRISAAIAAWTFCLAHAGSASAADMTVASAIPAQDSSQTYNFSDFDPNATELSRAQSNMYGVPRFEPGAAFGFAYAPSVAVAGVPEPATWSITVLGFLGLGTALRRAGKKTDARLQGNSAASKRR